jgi:hypothetical protein
VVQRGRIPVVGVIPLAAAYNAAVAYKQQTAGIIAAASLLPVKNHGVC